MNRCLKGTSGERRSLERNTEASQLSSSMRAQNMLSQRFVPGKIGSDIDILSNLSPNRYGDEENGEWGEWHNVGPKADKAGKGTTTTVNIGSSTTLSSFSYRPKREFLCIQNEDGSKRFKFQTDQNIEETSSEYCLSHSPVGAKLSYISGSEEDDTFWLTFHWIM